MDFPESIWMETRKYREKAEAYLRGETDGLRFKTYRVSMGIYEQRKSNTFMVRARIPAGVVSLPQLETIHALAEQFGGFVHITTRQDIQFQGVTLAQTVQILEALGEAGIVTRGTGGNTTRNVGCAPRSGVEPGEAFDVTPHAEAVTNYLLKDPSSFNLPRKFKLAFSNTPSDDGNATIADLGFIAKIKDGQRGFEVYGGGGLGGQSRPSLLLQEFIPETEVLYAVQAMKTLFEMEGDRSNKHKARIRHIVHRIGEEAFIRRYQALFEELFKEKKLTLLLSEDARSEEGGSGTEDTGCTSILMEQPLVFPQKQKGLYSVYVHPERGNLRAVDLKTMVVWLKNARRPSIRLTNTQGLMVRDLTSTEAEGFLNLIKPFASSFDVDNAIACAGASTCQLGLCRSQDLLCAVKKRFEEVPESVKSQLPRLYISGCPNACGQHFKGAIGLSGKALRTADGLVPFYTIYLGGRTQAPRAQLAQPMGDIPARKVPDFLAALAELRLKGTTESFEAFIDESAEAVLSLIQAFNSVEPRQENPELYYDFGADTPFTLKGRGPGECSAGVLDVIQMDLSNADKALADYKADKDSQHLYRGALSASRALLILKGIDTAKDREIFDGFIRHFVREGYLKPDIETVKDCLLDYKLGDLSNLDAYAEDIVYWVDRVKAMYASLNPQLEITLEKEARKTVSEAETPKDICTDIQDLRGVPCPMNFVKAKVILSALSSGETAAFYLDDGEPIQNVPRSLQGEGHEILELNEQYPGYNLLRVRKK